jgi:hypothetical protein
MIDLPTTNMNFSELVPSLSDLFVDVWRTDKLERFNEFCVVFHGWENVSAEWKAHAIDTFFAGNGNRVVGLSAPKAWRMPQVLKALGAFASTGEARRNGWDREVPEGLTPHIVRIAKVRGVVWTFSPTQTVLTDPFLGD